MAKFKNVIMAAAGAGGGDTVDVDEVFSAYSYQGDGTGQSIQNGIALADGVGGGTSTQFAGEDNNNLRRTSDFSGNSDSKTFTFSAWVLRGHNPGQHFIYSADDGTYSFSVSVKSGGDILLTGYEGTTRRLQATQSSGALPVGSWFHLLISIDLSNSSNRYVYINDVDKTSQFGWTTYSNDPIEFTRSNHNIAQQAIYAGVFKGNLAHVYLDYTYRNLSTTSNRRLFIDADGGSTPPSTLSALNPIMYLPMTEDYSIGENLGTGGDLTANGPPTIVNSGTEYLSDHGKGGMVWFKCRTSGLDHMIYDTERSTNKINPATAEGETAYYGGLTSYNPYGFSVGNGNNANSSGDKLMSWTFRKAPKFFDVVTYTGNGSTQTISHNLGCDVGFLMVKRLDASESWYGWHRSGTTTNGYIELNNNAAYSTYTGLWGNTSPTSTQFTVNNDIPGPVNASGATYVAYLWAHNDGDGEFGPDGDQDIIKCGSFTMGTQATIDLGFEPQWLMVKKASGTGQWMIVDSTRGWGPEADIGTQYYQELLYGNLTNSGGGGSMLYTTKSGFVADSTGTGTFIYIAIRRGPLAVPDDATKVFDVKTLTVNNNLNGTFVSSSTGQADMLLTTQRSHQGLPQTYLIDNYRMGFAELQMGSSAAETRRTDPYYYQIDLSNGLLDQWSWPAGSATTPSIYWMWKRAPGYLDIVSWEGDSTQGRNIPHNLGVAPEMVWTKSRYGTYAGSADFKVYHKDVAATKALSFQIDNPPQSGSWWSNTAPTATNITVGDTYQTNRTGATHAAWLFASVDGISKVGSYTGNGSSQTINCGFSAGARFVLIKRTDSTGNWYIWDTARGIVSGNDPYLLLNSTAAEVTSNDSVDPANSGFIVNQVSATNINVSSATYIFYAVA